MFDILDSNLGFGSASLNQSRSASMKKLSPKESNTKSKMQNNKFDDLIQSFVKKQTKSNIIQNTPSSAFISNRKFDSINVNVDMTRSREMSPKTSVQGSAAVRTSMFGNLQDDDDKVSVQFGRTQQTISNPSKIQDSFVSMRQMKPPIRARQKQNTKNQSYNSRFGQVIPEQDNTIANSSNKYDESDKGSRVSRRSSIDDRIGGDTIAKNMYKSQLPYNKGLDRVKQENSAKHESDFNSKNKIQKPICKQTIAQYEKQIQVVKQTYKKQIVFLQQSLDKLNKQCKQQRTSIMGELERLLEEQNIRMTKMHQEEISRVKQISQWQRQRMQQAYQAQIQCLKRSLEYKNQSQKISKTPTQNTFEDFHLKTRENTIIQKEQALSHRQLQLDSKINQFYIERRKIQQQLRTQRKRLMQLQTKLKRQLMQGKREVSQQKQRMAAEIGQIEVSIAQQKQNLALEKHQLELNRAMLSKEKEEIRRANQELAVRQRQIIDQQHTQIQKSSELEMDLINKIKIVQMRARDMNCQSQLKLNSSNQQSQKLLRPLSAGKSNTHSTCFLGKQKQLMGRIQKLNTSKRLDLGAYVQRVDKISKTKQRFF